MTTPKGPDAGLRSELRKGLPAAQWTHVESPVTSPGVPDTEFVLPGGVQGWVECKKSTAWAVTLRPLQISWLTRRCRLGGRAFVAVRRLTPRGDDELWLFRGSDAPELSDGGLRVVAPLGRWAGRPALWDWVGVEYILRFTVFGG
jgi:hypothetical protein